jgi:hypothetical protein
MSPTRRTPGMAQVGGHAATIPRAFDVVWRLTPPRSAAVVTHEYLPHGKTFTQPDRRRPERRQDPRLTAERIRTIEGESVKEQTYAIVVSPVELPDGRVLVFHGPQVVAFNLFDAQRRAKRGTKAQRHLGRKPLSPRRPLADPGPA